MLRFVGLGLWDERSVTIRGRDAIRRADRVFAERYTSRLTGASFDTLERFHDTDITVLEREDVEQHPDQLLQQATDHDVAFLVGGDPMVSTTHVDLRLRAADRGIETEIIHGTSAASAAASLTGLQNYRFGKATTIPFPETFGGNRVPQSVIDTIESNRDRGLHTIAFLDLDESGDRNLTADTAAGLVARHDPDMVGVVIARAGSDAPVVRADRLPVLAEMDFGGPLHLLVIPGTVHEMEAEALETFAAAPRDCLEIA